VGIFDRPMFSKASGLPIYRKSDGLLIWGDPDNCGCCGPMPCRDCCVEHIQGPATVTVDPASCGEAIEGVYKCELAEGVYAFDYCIHDSTSSHTCHYRWSHSDSGWVFHLHLYYCLVTATWCSYLWGSDGTKIIVFGSETNDCGCQDPPADWWSTDVTGLVACDAETHVLAAGYALAGDVFASVPSCEGCTASVSI